MSRSNYAFALVAVAAALAIAGCGSSSSSSSSGGGGGAYGSGGGSSTASSETTTKPEASAEGTNVSLGNVNKVGLVLVDSKGFTLYDFHKDKGGKSACYGECAAVWPPLTTTGAPTPGNGASASKLGVVKRTDGTMQVTYAGHPLYTYVADKKPGEANGNDFSSFGGQWYALKGSGEEAGG